MIVPISKSVQLAKIKIHQFDGFFLLVGLLVCLVIKEHVTKISMQLLRYCVRVVFLKQFLNSADFLRRVKTDFA